MQLTRLSNGLRLLTVPLHDTKAVTIFVFTKFGSRYENRDTNGIAHFIEHLMFKGTAKRPSTLDISRALDGVGASYNAMTSKDWTGYYVKINAEHTALALDVLSDMVRHSLFKPAEIERERGVIIEEINMYEDNPKMSIEDIFETVIFGDHHPLGWSIAGPREVIRRVSRKKLLAYRQQYYQAQNMWVVVAGRLQPQLNDQLKRYFSAIEAGRKIKPARPYRPVVSRHPVHLKYKDSTQVQLALGTKAFAYTDRRLPALGVLSTLLGGNMSSRLFIQIRERRGLAYAVQAGLNPYEDTGSFMVLAGLEKNRVPEAMKVILNELKKLVTTRVTGAELARTKEFIRGKTILDLEDSDSIATWYGRQALFHKKIETPEQALAKIAKVSAADIQTIARSLFRPANYRLAIIGPFKDPAPFQRIIRQG